MGMFGWFRPKEVQLVVPQLSHEQFLAALGVPDTEPWWLAVNYLLDVAEKETIDEARCVTANPNLVIAAVGAGEGINLVRTKLKEARELALRGEHASKESSATRIS